MAISEAFTGSETVTTTEWSMTTDTAGPDAQTDDGFYQLWLDLSAMAAGDQFRVKGYEKVASGGTQRAFEVATFTDAQAIPHIACAPQLFLHGWDYTIIKVAGTDRSITWSIRKVA